MQLKLAALLVFASVLLLGCLNGNTASNESTPTPQSSPVPTVFASATATSTPLPSPAASPTPTTTPMAVASPTPLASPAASEVPSPSVQASPTPGIVEVSMTAQRFSFSPSEVRVKKGALVRFIVSVPAGDTTHGLSMPDFGVSETLSAGETKTIEFTASKTGTFTFFCSVFCGSGHGTMAGKVIVE